MNSSKTQDLKSFKMNTSEKTSGVSLLRITLFRSPHQYHSMELTLPLFSYSYALFCTAQNAISNHFRLFRTLCTKHPGGGTPFQPDCLALPSCLCPGLAEFRVSNFDFRPSFRMEQNLSPHVFTAAEVISMRKSMMTLGVVMLFAAALTIHPRRGFADDSIRGDWRAKFMSGKDCACFDLEVQRSSWGHRQTWGNTHKISEFAGLDSSIATAKDAAVHFELRRDAGIISFDGRFHDGEGSGKFTFASSAEYIQGMKSLGYSNLSQEDLFSFTIHDVSRQFVKDMSDLGYRDLSTDDLVAFRIHGVSPEFTRAMLDLLPNKPSPDDLVAMRIHGVSPEFTKEINALLGKRFSVDDLVAFRIHGVSPEFVRQVRESVSSTVSSDDLVAMRIHGASPEFVKAMTSLMGRHLDVDDLVAFRIHGVSPEFTEQIQQLVEKDISSDDLVAFRIHGVSPEFVKEMKDAGYPKISPDQLVSMRIHGVDAAFVKEARDHGYKNPSIDDLIDLRIHGLRHADSL